jgi:hypothetical protein
MELYFVPGSHPAFRFLSLLVDFIGLLIHEVVECCEFVAVGFFKLVVLSLVALVHLIECPCFQILLQLLDMHPVFLRVGIVAVLLVDVH